MATNHPGRSRSKPGNQPDPIPAMSADPSAEAITSRSDVSAQAAATPEAQAANILIEHELSAIGEESGAWQGTSLAVAAIQASLDRLWVFSIPTRTIHGRIPGWLLGSILTAAWPLILNGVITLIYGRFALHTAEAWGWLAIFSITLLGALLSARILWGRLVRDMPAIVLMIPGQDSDRKLARWIRSWFPVLPQAIAGLTLAGLGAFVLWLASPTVGQYLELGPMSYLSVAWTSFMGGLVLYALAMVTLMTFAIRNCGPLTLDPWDPANTPGLRTLSRGYVYCLGLIIVMAAGLEIAATQVPGYPESFVLGIFVVGFPIFAVLCGVFVGLLPHLAIAHMTEDSKIRTKAVIDRAIGDLEDSMNDNHRRLATLVWLRSQVSAAPALPMKAPWFVPLAAALVGPLVAFLLTVKR
jgi:hypothetical protein